jgi:hypothetical protein
MTSLGSQEQVTDTATLRRASNLDALAQQSRAISGSPGDNRKPASPALERIQDVKYRISLFMTLGSCPGMRHGALLGFSGQAHGVLSSWYESFGGFGLEKEVRPNGIKFVYFNWLRQFRGAAEARGRWQERPLQATCLPA